VSRKPKEPKQIVFSLGFAKRKVPLDERELTLQEIEPLLIREKLSASLVVE
jgi:hypothetical protein